MSGDQSQYQCRGARSRGNVVQVMLITADALSAAELFATLFAALFIRGGYCPAASPDSSGLKPAAWYKVDASANGSGSATEEIDLVRYDQILNWQKGTRMSAALGEDVVELPICCERGMYFHQSSCHRGSETAGDAELPNLYTPDLTPSNKSACDFRKIYRYPCQPDSFAMDPKVDTFYFLENGSIFTVNLTEPSLITQLDYCLAVTMNSDNQSETLVAVCLPPDYYIPTFYTISCLLSTIFLTATFFIYMLIPELQNIHGIIVRAYVLVLAVAYFALTTVQFGDQLILNCAILCQGFAYIVHFSFLASFFWLNVMCFDIWWTFGGFRSLHGSVKQRERKKFIIYSIYAWGCASLITIICMIMDLVPGIPETFIRPEFGQQSCWFRSDIARAIYFYVPMGVTVFCNICLFILTALKILRHKKDTARQLKGSDSRRHDDNKQWFNLYLKLFIVMGINWSMEIISWIFEKHGLPKYVWYITDLTNTLQGVIIFIIFVWKDKIKRLLMKRFGCQGGNFLSRNSTRSGCPTSSTSRATCVTSAPLQEKSNPYATDPTFRTKSNVVSNASNASNATIATNTTNTANVTNLTDESDYV